MFSLFFVTQLALAQLEPAPPPWSAGVTLQFSTSVLGIPGVSSVASSPSVGFGLERRIGDNWAVLGNGGVAWDRALPETRVGDASSFRAALAAGVRRYFGPADSRTRPSVHARLGYGYARSVWYGYPLIAGFGGGMSQGILRNPSSEPEAPPPPPRYESYLNGVHLGVGAAVDHFFTSNFSVRLGATVGSVGRDWATTVAASEPLVPETHSVQWRAGLTFDPYLEARLHF